MTESPQRVSDWLTALTRSALGELLADIETSFEHPYGFGVVRLAQSPLEGWGLRVHFWPPKVEQELRQHIHGTRQQQVHAHGWTLVSRVFEGRLIEQRFLITTDSPESLVRYESVNSYGKGHSRLTSTGERMAVSLRASKLRSPDDGSYLIPAGEYHSTSNDCDRPSVSVVATELSDNVSSVIAPSDSGLVIHNERSTFDELELLRQIISKGSARK